MLILSVVQRLWGWNLSFCYKKGFINQSVGLHPVMSQFGLVVRHWAGKREDLNLILLWLSFLFRKVVVCGYSLMTLSITSY